MFISYVKNNRKNVWSWERNEMNAGNGGGNAGNRGGNAGNRTEIEKRKWKFIKVFLFAEIKKKMKLELS